MQNLKYIKTFVLLAVTSFILTGSSLYSEKVTAQPLAETPVTTSASNINAVVSAIDIVNTPKKFLNKTVVIKARFDKFSTLGLDYKSAFRSSEEYISFLIKRDDTKFDIPLSEMKLFLKRDLAEKFIDLKVDDEISIEGKVFSDALGDAWIDVEKLVLIKKAPEKDGVN